MHSPLSDWKEYKLSELGIFSRGKSKHRPRDDKRLFENGKYPLVQTGEIKDAMLYINHHDLEYGDFGLAQSKLWDKGTLCITIAANIAETAIISYPMCFPDSIVGFTANKNKSSALFMHYIFSLTRKSIQNFASGSIQDNINLKYLTNLKFKVPPKHYQDKIVAILSILDDKIELNNKINSELEAIARTLYDYWFVQFDFPDENGPYKSANGAMIYSDVLKRNIPAGWRVEKFNKFVTIDSGFPFNSDDYVKNGKWKIVTIKNVQDGNLDLSNTETIDELPSKISDFVKLKIGDVLMSLTGNVGRMCIVDTENLLLNQRVGKIIADAEFLLFSHLFLTSKSNRIRLERISNGSSQQNLSPIQAVDFQFALPPQNVLSAFNEIIKPIYEKLRTMKQETRHLAILRDFLLPMLMNGQAVVAD
ncbi:MAG: restriction endonuclease subunit S [Endomicrobium sp.]|jgi:type I restriction enzyme S subunit|nr:restriction endonuclease subunit S [Endomicrobium sp.]